MKHRVSIPIVLIMLLQVTIIPIVSGVDIARLDKMDDALEEALYSDSEKLDVLFQLNSPISNSDIDYINSLGAEITGDMKLLDGGRISASPSVIIALSNWDRVEYLELDRLLEFFYLPPEYGGDPGILMHETTHVVKATDAWHRVIVEKDGTIAFDTDGSFTEWDGDGTAIVDLDTGVDAGHPDYDYVGAWEGDKAIYSAKFVGTSWVETTNSDTSSGHGTHVGGTIAGNGDASAGRRAGVAKGGQLVALGTGDGASIFAAVQGLEWTYAHSTPGQNEHHIRVVSNSWGTDGDYDPSGAVAQLTDMLTFENDVAVIFAASNSGGSGSECQGDLRTNVYANTPAAISVAALTHDGTAVTSFSSRGCMHQQHTWPDVGAPGRDIWATAPRSTAIDLLTKAQGQSDLYYMAISGTSMATPHVGGIGGLLLNIAPSLGAADYHRDDHDEGTSIFGESAAYGQYPDWDDANYSRVHEVELILELTANYAGMANSCEAGNDEDNCNDIPEECYVSRVGKCHDWRVGHGLVDVDAATALARTTQLLRDPNDDGVLDNPEITVWDALDYYQILMGQRDIPLDTDRVRHSWKGEWNHFNNAGTGAVYYTEDAHYVFVPNGTVRMEVVFTATENALDTGQVGALNLIIDLGEDGSNDANGQGVRTQDSWVYDLDVDSSHWGKWAEFDVSGAAWAFWGFVEDVEFFESTIPYTVDVVLTLDVSEERVIEFEQRPDFYSDLDPASPSDTYSSGTITFRRAVYDQQTLIESYVPPKSMSTTSSSWLSLGGVSIFISSLIMLAAVVGVAMQLRSTRDEEILEAELIIEDSPA